MLTAYFDAANDPTVKGRPDRPLLQSVGCWMGYRDDWNRFRREWKAELERHGVGYFHATDFEWSLNQVINEKELPKDDFYYGWAKEDFLAFQKRLYRVLNRKRPDGEYRLVAFASNVHKADFDSKLPNELKGDPECQSYYIFNIANLMKQMAFWCNRHFKHYQRTPMHYIFAGGDVGEASNLHAWFDHCWNDDGDRYYYRLSKGYTSMGYDTQWMKGEAALQAADVATFELSKLGVEIAVRGHSNIPLDELRKSLPVLFHTSGLTRVLVGDVLVAAFDQIVGQRKSRAADRESGLTSLHLPPE